MSVRIPPSLNAQDQCLTKLDMIHKHPRDVVIVAQGCVMQSLIRVAITLAVGNRVLTVTSASSEEAYTSCDDGCNTLLA